jgi:hypothetical protein
MSLQDGLTFCRFCSLKDPFFLASQFLFFFECLSASVFNTKLNLSHRRPPLYLSADEAKAKVHLQNFGYRPYIKCIGATSIVHIQPFTQQTIECSYKGSSRLWA